jgi:proline iminopeptidase
MSGQRQLIKVILIAALVVLLARISPATPYPNSQGFDSGCQTLAYLEYGQGKPLVLLAGGPGMNPAYMVPIAKMLAAGNRRVLLLHQRGTGSSVDAISCRDRMNLAGAIADLEALRTHLRVEKLTIAGHSWGAMLAMAYAQEHPNRVAGLLLLDTGPVDQSGFKIEVAKVRARLTPEDRAALQRAKGEAQIDAIEQKAYFAEIGNVGRLQESIPAGEPLWYESVRHDLEPSLAKFDVIQGIRSLKAPVTLVFGRLDPGFFVAQQIQQVQPNSKLIVVEGAGHYPWLENYTQTATILKNAADSMP